MAQIRARERDDAIDSDKEVREKENHGRDSERNGMEIKRA